MLDKIGHKCNKRVLCKGPFKNMIKLSKLTDYAIILLSVLDKDRENCFSASTLSSLTGIPEPTTAKTLKMLCTGNLVQSIRGVKGGYKALESYEDVSVSHVIEVIEGDICVTDCAASEEHECSMKEVCPMDGCWNEVNQALYDTLNSIKLSSLMRKAKVKVAS